MRGFRALPFILPFLLVRAVPQKLSDVKSEDASQLASGQQSTHQGITASVSDKYLPAKLSAAKDRVFKELTENVDLLRDDPDAQRYLRSRWGFHFDVQSLGLLLQGANDERLVMVPHGMWQAHTPGVDLIWQKFQQYINIISKM